MFSNGGFLIEIANPPGVLGWGMGLFNPYNQDAYGGIAGTLGDVLQWEMDDDSLKNMLVWGNA